MFCNVYLKKMKNFFYSPPKCTYIPIVPDPKISSTPNIQPLPYQQESVSRISSHWKQGDNRVLAQQPTGAEKSLIIVWAYYFHLELKGGVA